MSACAALYCVSIWQMMVYTSLRRDRMQILADDFLSPGRNACP